MASVTLQGVYDQIDEQRSVLIKLLNMSKKNPISPNQLSDVCMKLSILNELLGGFLADLKLAQLASEAQIFGTAKEGGASDTGATSQARLGSVIERAEYEKAEVKHSDLWKLISMAQTHIRAEGEERKGI